MQAAPPITRDTLMDEVRARQPGFRSAVLADAATTAFHRGERHEFRSGLDAFAQVLRLTWQADAFAAQVVYRLRARLHALRVPLLPRVLHRLSVALCQVQIGDPVVLQPGVYLLHGQVVIDGLTEIGAGTTIGPFVTIGLRDGHIVGPTLEGGVSVGTGAKVLGEVRIGHGARIGANAVVLEDVAAETTVVGVPAGPAGSKAKVA
jgi:serine O-acetyltransferase